MLKIDRDLHLHGDPDRSVSEGLSVIGLFGGSVLLFVVGVGLLLSWLFTR